MPACSQCRRVPGTAISDADLDALADPQQLGDGAGVHGGGAGGAGAILALSAVKRLVRRRFAGYAFCAGCRATAGEATPPLRLVKVMAAVGFFAGFCLVGLPLAAVAYVVAALALRRAIARFDAAPRFAALAPLLEGYGVLVTSAGALAIVLVILGGVVAYIEIAGR